VGGDFGADNDATSLPHGDDCVPRADLGGMFVQSEPAAPKSQQRRRPIAGTRFSFAPADFPFTNFHIKTHRSVQRVFPPRILNLSHFEIGEAMAPPLPSPTLAQIPAVNFAARFCGFVLGITSPFQTQIRVQTKLVGVPAVTQCLL